MWQLEVDLDDILEKYTNQTTGTLRCAAFVAVNDDGQTIYAKAAGKRDFDATQPQPMELDSVLWIASITKLFTAVSCMIAIEKGLLTLETNAREIIPEFATLSLLEGFDETGGGQRKPILASNDTPITLRMLLSHSSGLVYDQHHPGIREWAKFIGKTEHTFSGTYHGLYSPLAYPPGKGWAYSTGMDWAGRMVEIVSGLSLEDFMQQNIFSELGMNSTTFRPELRLDLQEQRMSLGFRNKEECTLHEGKVPLANPAQDCSGGAGLYSTTADCVKLLTALMTGGGDILTPSSVDALMSPQLDTNKFFMDVIKGHGKKHLGQTWPDDAEGTFGLGSSICLDGFPGRRAANSCNWSGMPGLHCWIDRKSGIGGLLTTQILPPGDAQVTECLLDLEKALYKHIDTTE